MDFSNQNVSIFACQFTAFIEKAKVQIKFPCNYFLQWKANNGKIVVSSKNRYQANKSEIIFNESFNINVNMLYDKINKKYVKKQSLLMINLISKSRPDQIKLVGRVAIDLAEVLNSQSFKELSISQLEYCSVQATVNFKIQAVSVKQSTLHVSQLDRSSFNEYMSFQNNLKPFQQFVQRNEGSSTQRDFDDVGSARGSDKEEIRSVGKKDRNKSSSTSFNRQNFNQVNRLVSRNGSTLSQEHNKSNKSSRIISDLEEKKKILSPKNVERSSCQQQNNFSFNRNVEQELKPNVLTSSFMQDQRTIPARLRRETIRDETVKVDKDKDSQITKGESKRGIRLQLPGLISTQQRPHELRSQKKQQHLNMFSGSKTRQNSSLIQSKQKEQRFGAVHKPVVEDKKVAFRSDIVLKKQQITTTTNQSEQQPYVHNHLPVTIINQQLQHGVVPPLHLSHYNLTPKNKQTQNKRVSAQKQTEKQNHNKKQYVEVQRPKSESKRILGLTEALTEIQAKYTRLTLQTQELKNSWKKQKQQLLNTISKQQFKLNNKQKQLRQQQKIIDNLQKRTIASQQGYSQYQTRIKQMQARHNQLQVRHNQLQVRNNQLQRTHNEKLKQLISVRKDYQTINNENIRMRNETQRINKENKAIRQEAKKMQNELKQLMNQSQIHKDQQNKNYGQQRTVYKQQLKTYEQQIKKYEQQLKSHKEQLKSYDQQLSSQQLKINHLQEINSQQVKQLAIVNEQLDELFSQNELIKTEIKFLQQQNRNYIDQINTLKHQIQQQQSSGGLINKQKGDQYDDRGQNRQQHKNGEQMLVRKLSCKDQQQQLSQQLRTKCQQVQNVRRLCEQQIVKIRQQCQQQHHRLEEVNHSLIEKNQQLQTTLLALNDQLTHYQQRLTHYEQQLTIVQQQLSILKQQLQIKQQQITTITQIHNHATQSQSQKLTQREQLLLQLNAQKQLSQQKLIQLAKQIQQLQQVVSQKDSQLQLWQQQNDSIKHQLQILKAQSTIYDQKLQSLHQQFQLQLQTNKVTYNKKITTLQTQLQQQLNKSQLQIQQHANKQHQMHRLHLQLQQSLQEWQNKCTQNTISSSKIVSQLNDIIKEKESTMYEMENIMKMLQKDKLTVQELMRQKDRQFNNTLQLINEKHSKLMHHVETQQSEVISLYELVSKQRMELKQTIHSKDMQISQANTNSQKLTLRIQQLTHANDELVISLQELNNELSELKIQHNKQLQFLRSVHSQQTQQYEQRVRELMNSINIKDNQSVQREIIVIELQKQIHSLQQQLQLKTQQLESCQKEIQSKLSSLQSIQHQLQAIQYDMQLKNQLIEDKNQSISSKQSQIQTYIQQQQQLQSKIQILQQQIQLNVEINKTQSQQQLINYSKLENTLLQCQQSYKNKLLSLSNQIQSLKTNLQQSSQVIIEKQQSLIKLNNNFTLIQQKLSTQHEHKLSTIISQTKQTQQQLNTKIIQLQSLIILQDQQLALKNTQYQSLQNEKNKISNQLNQLKNDRQILTIINFKQHSDQMKSQINKLKQEIITLNNQLKQIPLLQRALKIKTIEINSLKFKTSTVFNPSNTNNTNSCLQDIIKLKDQEIEFFKQQNQKMKNFQLQLYQVEALNQDLYQDIEQYEQEKFHLNSGMNEKNIKIIELENEMISLLNAKTQWKEKNHELSEKVKYYENLILDYKGHEISLSKSQSQKFNLSHVSSSKLMQNSCQVQTQNSRLIDMEIFVKKIGLLEGEIQKLRERQQQLMGKDEQNQLKLKEYESKMMEYEMRLEEKELELVNVNQLKSPPVTPKSVIQYRNPQRIVGTLKELQNLLKKRSQFHNLQNSLIKLYNSNHQQSKQKQDIEIEHITWKQQECEIIAGLTSTINQLANQFQSLKAKIMKLQGKNYQQKAKIISLLKPIENIIQLALKSSEVQ